MMAVLNFFSSLFTLSSLFIGFEAAYVGAFLLEHPLACSHIFLMSVCSATGQLFIFYTIKAYGPLVFATIQTVRQFLSVVLSIMLFAHPVNSGEVAGILVVFTALASQIALKAKSVGKKPAPPPTAETEMGGPALKDHASPQPPAPRCSRRLDAS